MLRWEQTTRMLRWDATQWTWTAGELSYPHSPTLAAPVATEAHQVPGCWLPELATVTCRLYSRLVDAYVLDESVRRPAAGSIDVEAVCAYRKA